MQLLKAISRECMGLCYYVCSHLKKNWAINTTVTGTQLRRKDTVEQGNCVVKIKIVWPIALYVYSFWSI